MAAGPSTPDAAPDVLIVANPYSGWRANRDRVAVLIEATQRQGLTARTVWDLAAPASLETSSQRPGERPQKLLSSTSAASAAGRQL